MKSKLKISKLGKIVSTFALTTAVGSLTVSSLAYGASPNLIVPKVTSGTQLNIVDTGDSYASGPGINPNINFLCGRSTLNYGHVAAKILDANLTDVTCQGAVTSSYTESQLFNIPQINAVTPKADVVLASIGGNDVNVLSLLNNCANEFDKKQSCGFNTPQTQEVLQQTQQKITGVYQNIRSHAPNALIIGVGYGQPIGDKSCPAFDLNPQNLSDARLFLKELNQLVKTSVQSVGGYYFNPGDYTTGHALCSTTPWYAGVNGGVPAGQQGTADHPTNLAMNAIGTGLATVIPELIKNQSVTSTSAAIKTRVKPTS